MYAIRLRYAIVRLFFFFSSRRRHTRLQGDWSSDVCSSDLSMRRSASSRRKGTAWTPSSLSDERRQFLLVRLPAHVVGVVVPSSIDHDELRSEERRVGKECRSRWSPYH